MNQNREGTIIKIMKEHNGFLQRSKAEENGISPSMFSRYVLSNGLEKVSPGVYASVDSVVDDMFILQKRYPKIIFSGMSALYLLRLTDKIPNNIEFTVPKGYRVRKESIKMPFVCHIENRQDVFQIGNVNVQTLFGNEVSCFGMEKQIVEMIRKRRDYDSETFIKGIKTFLCKKNTDMAFLFEYARMRNIENKVFAILEIMNYEN